MLKTNCKIVNDRIKAFILSAYNTDTEFEYSESGIQILDTKNGTDIKSVCKNIYNVFRAEKAYENESQQTFSYWISGLCFPLGGDWWLRYSALDILSDILEYTPAEKEKYSDDFQACKFLDWLIYRVVKSYNR